jgi:hypothetical protein
LGLAVSGGQLSVLHWATKSLLLGFAPAPPLESTVHILSNCFRGHPQRGIVIGLQFVVRVAVVLNGDVLPDMGIGLIPSQKPLHDGLAVYLWVSQEASLLKVSGDGLKDGGTPLDFFSVHHCSLLP